MNKEVIKRMLDNEKQLLAMFVQGGKIEDVNDRLIVQSMQSVIENLESKLEEMK